MDRISRHKKMILHDPTATFLTKFPICGFLKPQKSQRSLCHLNVWNPTPLCTPSSSGTSLVCLKGWTETNKISPFSDSSEPTQIHSHVVAGNEGLHPKNLRVKSDFFLNLPPLLTTMLELPGIIPTSSFDSSTPCASFLTFVPMKHQGSKVLSGATLCRVGPLLLIVSCLMALLVVA